MTLLLFLSILLCLYDHVDINGIVNCVECVSCVERVDHVECVSCVNCVNCVFHRYRMSFLSPCVMHMCMCVSCES